MRSCQEALERLHTFVDRELTEEETREVHAHLEACPPCMEHFAFQVTMKRLVHRCVCQDAAPPALRERIVRTCCSQQVAPPSSRRAEPPRPGDARS